MAAYKHILCPSDLSAGSDAACYHACELAAESGAKVTLLHVVDHFPQDRSNQAIAPENQDPREFQQERALKALGEQVERIDCRGAHRDVHFTSHASAYGIIHYAASAGVDLIVMARHGHEWPENLLGDTARTVQHKSGVEVLLVPVE